MSDPGAVERLSGEAAAAVLSAIDRAFEATLHGRYGGGILLAATQPGYGTELQALRPVPVGLPGGSQEAIVLELTMRGGDDADAVPGFSAAAGLAITAIGVVAMAAEPGRGAADVHVLTEIFDDHDPNEPADQGSLHTGLLLAEAPMPMGGQMPGRGVQVVRSGASIAEDDAAGRQGQRGWLPLQPRNRVNRGGGLGSNGHTRASVPGLSYPVSRALLKHLGDHLGAEESIGSTIERVVLGLQSGPSALPC